VARTTGPAPFGARGSRPPAAAGACVPRELQDRDDDAGQPQRRPLEDVLSDLGNALDHHVLDQLDCALDQLRLRQLYRIRNALRAGADKLTRRQIERIGAGLQAGDAHFEVTVAWLCVTV
jgi:hypothetical protein